jgi:multiple sugar transport system permease protein
MIQQKKQISIDFIRLVPRTTGSNKLTMLCAVVVSVWSFLPVYWMINLSLQPPGVSHSVPGPLFPFHPNVNGYITALHDLTLVTNDVGYGRENIFHQGVTNSLLVATLVMIFTMVLSVPTGYALARFTFPFRTTFFFLIILVRSIAPVSILIPLYRLYKLLSMGGTYQGIVLAHLTLTVPLIAWVSAGIFAAIPGELDKQGRVDGCSRFRIIWNVLLPVAAPGLIVVAVLSWITSWNEWVFALYLADSQGLRMVSDIVGGVGQAEFVLTLVPVIIAAVLLERYMTRLNIIAPPSGTADYGLGHPNR